jgi:glycosyltransferase involved in cell wall biosynthesis
VRVLLLSAYAAQSHRYWQLGLRQMFPHWQWVELELPARHFSWRVRGNPLFWSVSEREVLESGFQLLVATSMVDLATLRGLVPALANVPSLLYFHENQFEFPQDRQQHSLLEAQMVSIYSAMAADRLAFNSAYNRDSFLSGCSQLFARLPDFVPERVVDAMEEKTEVLPVPLLPVVEAQASAWRPEEKSRALRILWNARFEHDKGGEGLHRILKGLEPSGLHYQLAVTGQQFRNSPAVFSAIQRDFEHRLVQFGYMDSAADYHALQAGADIILSTALHEFQGLAVMQAVRAGCMPLVPDRLAYREMYPEHCRYQSCPDNLQQEADSAITLLLALAARPSVPIDMSAYSIEQLRPRYLRLLQSLQDSQPQPS